MSTSALSHDDAVVRYAANAFAVVLDQHELPVPAERVAVFHLYQDTYALHFLAAEQLEAHGLYQGNAAGGTITLGVVHKKNDQGQTLFCRDFRTVDRFAGTKSGPEFTPRLLFTLATT